jgi:hypothetical protein
VAFDRLICQMPVINSAASPRITYQLKIRVSAVRFCPWPPFESAGYIVGVAALAADVSISFVFLGRRAESDLHLQGEGAARQRLRGSAMESLSESEAKIIAEITTDNPEADPGLQQ